MTCKALIERKLKLHGIKDLYLGSDSEFNRIKLEMLAALLAPTKKLSSNNLLEIVSSAQNFESLLEVINERKGSRLGFLPGSTIAEIKKELGFTNNVTKDDLVNFAWQYIVKKASSDKSLSEEKQALDSAVKELIQAEQTTTVSQYQAMPPVAANTGWQQVQLEFKGELGKGAYGVVHRVVWNGKEYAAKYVQDPSELAKFVEEGQLGLEITQKCGRSGIIKTEAVVVDQKNFVVILTELANKGELKALLQKETLAADTKVSLVQDILKGMYFQHQVGYIHRDIAGRNILVEQDQTGLHAKIADFGRTQRIGNLIAEEVGPLKWMSQGEILNRGLSSMQSDLWAIAVTINELMTDGKAPYEGYTEIQVATDVMNGKLSPITDATNTVREQFPALQVIQNILVSDQVQTMQIDALTIERALINFIPEMMAQESIDPTEWTHKFFNEYQHYDSEIPLELTEAPVNDVVVKEEHKAIQYIRGLKSADFENIQTIFREPSVLSVLGENSNAQIELSSHPEIPYYIRKIRLISIIQLKLNESSEASTKLLDAVRSLSEPSKALESIGETTESENWQNLAKLYQLANTHNPKFTECLIEDDLKAMQADIIKALKNELKELALQLGAEKVEIHFNAITGKVTLSHFGGKYKDVEKALRKNLGNQLSLEITETKSSGKTHHEIEIDITNIFKQYTVGSYSPISNGYKSAVPTELDDEEPEAIQGSGYGVVVKADDEDPERKIADEDDEVVEVIEEEDSGKKKDRVMPVVELDENDEDDEDDEEVELVEVAKPVVELDEDDEEDELVEVAEPVKQVSHDARKFTAKMKASHRQGFVSPDEDEVSTAVLSAKKDHQTQAVTKKPVRASKINQMLYEFNQDPNKLSIGSGSGRIIPMEQKSPMHFFNQDLTNTVEVKGDPNGKIHFNERKEIECTGTDDDVVTMKAALIAYLAQECSNKDEVLHQGAMPLNKQGKPLELFVNQPEDKSDNAEYAAQIKQIAIEVFHFKSDKVKTYEDQLQSVRSAQSVMHEKIKSVKPSQGFHPLAHTVSEVRKRTD